LIATLSICRLQPWPGGFTIAAWDSLGKADGLPQLSGE
jgi:hypothetical protein